MTESIDKTTLETDPGTTAKKPVKRRTTTAVAKAPKAPKVAKTPKSDTPKTRAPRKKKTDAEPELPVQEEKTPVASIPAEPATSAEAPHSVAPVSPPLPESPAVSPESGVPREGESMFPPQNVPARPETPRPTVVVESYRSPALAAAQQQGGQRQDRDRNHGRFRNRDRYQDRDRNQGDRNQEHAQNRDQEPHDGDSQQGQQLSEPRPEQPRPEPVYGEGIVEVSGKGFGFLRDPKRNFVQNPQDIFVTPEVVRRFSLRDGMWLKGEIRRGNRGPQLFRLTEVNGEDPEKARNLPTFDELTVVSPNKRIKLETTPDRYTTRIMDMMTPIGKGQRGLIVAPPRTGKTTLLQHIADAVVKNHPEMKLIILLVDERPEEVTEIRRTVPTADIMASSNDSDLKSHTRIAQLAIERARRLVEAGKDVFVLLDSITRVGRAFNNAMGGGGRTMSGGIDARALEIPRKLFAAARNTEEAGSLTIIATALIETGSRMDELIFQEFKGTGNMEMVLDRKISDLRIYPAIDIFKSGTRREELLLNADDLHKINVIRRGLAGHKPEEAIERLLSFVRKFPTNAVMLREIPG